MNDPLRPLGRLQGHRSRPRQAFTMIEIAISLAIIGFALIAIIGILPAGMSVQRENREETIVNQDALVLMNAIRNGETGVNDLTNYVVAITNIMTRLDETGRPAGSITHWYTPTDSSTAPKFPLINGFRIVGLLSTPRLVSTEVNGVLTIRSNYVIANMRSISGPASEKFPQNNPDVQDLALSYRLLPYVASAGTNHYFDTTWTNFTDARLYSPTNQAEIDRRKYYYEIAREYAANVHDVRLVFRWPLLPRGRTGTFRQVVRTTVSGPLQAVVEDAYQNPPGQPQPPEFTLYFLRPRTFVKAP